MSGPHVFAFAKDGTIVRADVPSGIESRPPSRPKLERSVDKPWKNVAITEQDEAMEARAEMRSRAEEKARLVGLVYAWPPAPRGAACTECEVSRRSQQRAHLGMRASVSTSMGMRGKDEGGKEESVVPALSYGSSGESESEGEVYRAVSRKRNGEGRQEVSMEKRVGYGRPWRKAPGRHLYVATEGESAWTDFGMVQGVGKQVSDPACLLLGLIDQFMFLTGCEPADDRVVGRGRAHGQAKGDPENA